MLTVPADVLFELERELGEPRFMGVPIGSTLGALFHRDLFIGQGCWDAKCIWKDRLRFRYHYWHGVLNASRQKKTSKANPGRVLFPISSNQSRVADLLFPVIKRIGTENSFLLVRHDGILDKVLENYDYATINSLSYKWSLWSREFQRCYPVWRRKLNRFLRDNRIPSYIMPRLCDALVIQSQRVVAYHRVLDEISPKAIVTSYDRSELFSPLVLAAIARHIPTITMLHGVINPPYGYVPLLADLALCWGHHSFDQLVQMGTEPWRLKVVGYQRIKQGLDVDRAVARAKFNVFDDRPLVLLISNPIHPTPRRHFVRQFCEALSTRDVFKGAVRLHPSETLDFYAKEIQEFSTIKFIDAGMITQEETLAATDVIVSHSSGFGNDALAYGKPVLIFDAIDAPLGNARVLIEQAGCPQITSARELIETVAKITVEPEFYESLKSKADDFLKYEFAAIGDEAVENIVEVINEYLINNLNLEG